MRSFEHGYLLETPVSHSFVMSMRAIGEFRGRHMLYAEQSPEVLETLRHTAMIQSTESSNRIEGISLERIIEESKETYYDALLQSSRGWHEAKHDLRPWWEYFLGMLTAAYNEFESRVGAITSGKGAKREMVESVILHLPQTFRFGDIQRACPGISYPTLKRALADLKRKKKLKCLGKGRDAQWRRIVS